jgi:hypothetical protein
MGKIKDFFKEISSNKRKKAIFSLAFWIIFIFVITRMIGKPPSNIPINNSNNKSNVVDNSKSGKDNFNKSNSFEFDYKINYIFNKKNYSFNIVGTFYDDRNYFEFNNNKYYEKEGKIYIVNEEGKSLKQINKNQISKYFGVIDIQLLLKSSLYTIIDSSVEESKTSYRDGSTLINYTYKTSDNKKIILSTTEDNGIINNIELDFKNYYTNKKYDLYKVTCILKNINNIAEYNKNYDTYKIEGE